MKNSHKLEPWQKEALTKVKKGISKGIKKGETFVIYGTGRRTGKSKSVMDAVAKKFFEDRAAQEWSEWESDWLLWPTRSIDGKYIRGRVYSRYKMVEVDAGGDFSGYSSTRLVKKYEYANEKELFKWKLKYGARDNTIPTSTSAIR